MDLGLEGQTVLVTGSTAGIGLAAATAFAREKARVIVNGRTEERVSKAKEKIAKEIPGAKVEGVAADLSTAAGAEKIVAAFPDVDVLVNGRTEERVEKAKEKIAKEIPGAKVEGVAADLSTAAGAEKVVAAFPDVDVLVNNAGVFAPVAFEDIPDAEWLRFFETNVLSGVRLSRHYFPRMLKKDYGRILFISSESAIQIPVEMIHYGTTKTAQLAVARGLAERTRGTGVTVNSVLPGPTASDGVGDFVKELAKSKGMTFEAMEKEFFAHARPSSLLARFATVEEIANMIVYLGSRAASATNGASVRVDGGVVRAI